jgi:hypothetical protein
MLAHLALGSDHTMSRHAVFTVGSGWSGGRDRVGMAAGSGVIYRMILPVTFLKGRTAYRIIFWFVCLGILAVMIFLVPGGWKILLVLIAVSLLQDWICAFFSLISSKKNG